MIPSPRRILRHAASLSMALMVLAVSGAQDLQAQDFDLTGEWVFNTMSPNGAGTRDVTFVQDGNTLTGEIASSMAAGDLEGTIDGNTITFVAVVYMESGAFEITYQATYEDGELVDGSIDFGDYGSGTFTGHRKEDGGQG